VKDSNSSTSFESFRSPIIILVTASGLSIGTLFTLFVVPAMYIVLAAVNEQQKSPIPATQNSQD